MSNTQNVSTGKPKIGGAVFRAPLGTPLPTSVDEALNPAFEELGFVSEDGVTSSNTRASEQIKAWGGTVVLTPQTEYSDTWKAIFIEALNMVVLRMVFGDGNVSGDIATGIKISANAEQLPAAAYIFDMILNGAKKRVVLPNASISEVGDVTYVDNDVIGYDVTLAALPDAEENTHYEYIKTDTSQIRYTVAFDSTGGSSIATQQVRNGQTATRPANPVKEGFTFVEWQKDGAAYDFNAPVTENITLTAAWIENAKTFSVTQSLTNVTSTFTADSIAEGEALEATLTAEDTYTIDSVEVTMGGNDITSTAWDDAEGKVTIAAVDGDVVITAIAA